MTERIEDALRRRVLVLDGAMGTMIQRLGLSEADFRGSRFAHSTVQLKGCNDLLCLTRPDDIAAIHRAYVDAGADIIETNTFNANAISMADYGLEEHVREINLAGARLACEVAAGRAWVAGSMGPTNVSLSMPTGHSQTFDSLTAAYTTQAKALIDGGVDLLLIETVFDPINAKAAILACRRALMEAGREVPLMISATLTEGGRLLSGQSLEAFVMAIQHARPLTIGLNCGFGADKMMEHLPLLADTPYYISAHSNAGLPDEMGHYCEPPGHMARHVAEMLERQLVNVVGGCCGTTPEHVAAIARVAAGATPRTPPADTSSRLQLSGNEPMRHTDFIKVGERCNVAGSRKFLRLISQGCIDEAVDIAADQIAKGASVLDVNMDDGMLDARAEMERFVCALATDSRTAAVPLMIDSSDMEVITAALKRLPGRSIVNSISLKEGEEAFLSHARAIRELGAAVVVMAFDEQGQATTVQRRIDICSRAYRLLTERAGFRGRDIVFDPNVLTIATGIPEHDRYALDFLEATEWITGHLPEAKVSGGISNLSFAFRGHNRLREAMHTIFISHARNRGMELAIVNPSTPLSPDESCSAELREAIDDVLFMRRPDATERLLDVAHELDAPAAASKPTADSAAAAPLTLDQLVVKGSTDRLEELIADELQRRGTAMAVVSDVLMAGMNRVGELFGSGKMFLPQVVKSAGTMKRAVEILTPRIEAESGSANGAESSGPVMVLATVKGDVHDIGKNIVAVVMRCSGFRVVDLGVMVPATDIIAAARRENADCIGLSGLITPSLAEMAEVAGQMEAEGLSIPLFVGGATTSAVHTAVKLAPHYSGGVIHTTDAASLPQVARLMTNPATAAATLHDIRATQEQLRMEHERKSCATDTLSAGEARLRAETVDSLAPQPQLPVGVTDFHLTAAEVSQLINWRAFLGEWQMPPAGDTPEARALIDDARALIGELGDSPVITARAVVCRARRTDADQIELNGGELLLPTPRALTPNPATGRCPALCDFVTADGSDHVTLFAVTANLHVEGTTDYHDLMRQTVAHRLAEAATEWLHRRVTGGLGIRPAVGYPSLPDQSLIFTLDQAVRYQEIGITLTSTGAMHPSATTSGIIIGHPQAHYFAV